MIVAEDQEQVDKILALKDQLPALKLVIYEDSRGMLQYRSAALRALDEVEELGRRFGAEHPGYFEAEIDKGRLDDVALFAYTSGTTGTPKGAMLTHANMVETGHDAHQVRGRPAGRQLAGLSADGVGGRLALHPRHEPDGRVHGATARRARRRCSATCASSGPPRCWPRPVSGRTC